ncbi:MULTISPECIES: periplasmic nitrate reductase, NapE protein [unclassified Stappia]|uniref:periplasmic nitrate reductase, NapE protein n=1 Tax=unclassified Stappia TaxID=2629676 RepID=UPI0016437794|nr:MULTISPECIES: periplasmic nitrate reductase, NapE protein [unclassified Stappia]
MTESGQSDADGTDRRRWRMELLAFLVLAFGVWPFVAVAVVGTYGFAVWMLQLIFGPPGPPAALL